MITAYEMTRPGTTRSTWVALCPRHAEARRVLGYELAERPDAEPQGPCDDCAEAGASVLDAVIAADDAAAAKDEPEPVKVLPGQGRLFE